MQRPASLLKWNRWFAWYPVPTKTDSVSNRTLLINKLFEWRAEFRATVSVAAPKNSEVNGAFHTTRRTQVKSVSSSYGFAIDFGVCACLNRSQL